MKHMEPRKLSLIKEVSKYKQGKFISKKPHSWDDDDEQSIGEETSLSY